jgi:hypothetical protein
LYRYCEAHAKEAALASAVDASTAAADDARTQREVAERALVDEKRRNSAYGQMAAGALDMKCISEEDAAKVGLCRLHADDPGFRV